MAGRLTDEARFVEISANGADLRAAEKQLARDVRDVKKQTNSIMLYCKRCSPGAACFL